MGTWRKQWARRRALRRLQRAYYASIGGTEVIAEYFRVLAEARDEELKRCGRDAMRPIALHVGSGGHYLSGWINVDFVGAPPVDVASDLSSTIPFRSATVDFIHSEDFIEHIDLDAGKRFLAEAFRVLKPGGVMRILTPDLRALIDRVYQNREPAHLAWCRTTLDARGPCESLNMHLRMGGEHRFIYDEELLRALLRENGFEVRRVRWNTSREPFLRYLDLRDFGLNLFLEAVKPLPSS